MSQSTGSELARSLHFIDGESEMAKLTRDFAWENHSLGKPEFWPIELKSSLSLMLNSGFAMFIAWGEGKTFFYNDAYAPILGLEKHPRALGAKFENVWKDIWKDLSSIVERVYEGESSYFEDLPLYMNRSGYFEQTYFTFSYSPIKNSSAEVVGLFCACVETTARKTAEIALKAEQAKLATVFEQAPSPMAMFEGRDHKFTFANQLYKQYFLSNKIFLGRTVADVLPEAVEQGFTTLLDGVYTTGQAYVGKEVLFSIADDRNVIRNFYFNFVYDPIMSSTGEVQGILAAIQDVTEQVVARELIEEGTASLRATMDSSAGGFYGVDQDGVTTVCNATFLEMLGFENIKDAVGKKLHDVIHHTHPDGTRYPKEECPIYLAANTGKPAHVEDEFFYRLDGSSIPVEYWTAPIVRGGKVLGAVTTFVDITERKKAQAELRAAKENAEKLKVEAEHANALKSAFLANMSHEIRTPLGAMMGFADLLKDPGITVSERQSFTNILSRNGESLSVIINDILDLSKVEAGHLTLEFTDTYPDQIGADVVSLLRVKANEKDLVLEYTHDETSPASVVADPIRVRQILLNLVGNAVKFTQFGSVVLRSFACKSKRGRDALCFEIADSGIGIAKDQQENVFEMFVQADGSMTRRFGGTGLGLSLSRHLARAMGGDVTITESQVGVGSKFLVTVEDQPERRNEATTKVARGPASPQELPEKALDGLKILVVDDAPDNQQLIWRYLTKQGAHVESAENGYLGYRAALAGRFDLVLMDIQMPVMDGYAATQKLREAGYTKPIIALTAHAMNEVRRRAFNVGYTDHLTKPINAKELVATIAKHARS